MNLDFIEKINKNNLTEFFPELEKLKDIVENNVCHNNELVFNHTMQVFDNCKLLIDKLNDDQRIYFNRIKIKNKIKNLFLSSVLFHDVGKIEMVKIENNSTSCINHMEFCRSEDGATPRRGWAGITTCSARKIKFEATTHSARASYQSLRDCFSKKVHAKVIISPQCFFKIP